MSSNKTFASAADLEEKKISFERLSEHAYAYTAEGERDRQMWLQLEG